MVALLKSQKNFEVVGTSTRPLEALEQIRLLNPDLLITDLEMPGLDGIELTKKVKEIHPNIRVLALSMHHDYEKISRMIDAGVQGYILKSTGKEELGQALQFLMEGHTFFSNETVEVMRKGNAQTEEKSTRERIVLTPREKEIVGLVAKEMSNEAIGNQLFISLQTVETHRKNIMRKTETKSAIGLVKMATENGWI